MHIVADYHTVHPDSLRPICYAREEAEIEGIPDSHRIVPVRWHINVKEGGGAVDGVSHVHDCMIGADRLRRVEVCGVPSLVTFKALEATNLGVFKTVLTSATRQS